ncbi:MAG: hypothetical protein NVSMB44_13000 [Ktedonobacteraceae bacterium]
MSISRLGRHQKNFSEERRPTSSERTPAPPDGQLLLTHRVQREDRLHLVSWCPEEMTGSVLTARFL